MRAIIRAVILAASGVAAALAQSPGPAIDPNLGVENAGNLNPGESLAAGSFVAIFGTNFATGLTLADTVTLSNSLANVSITFNNVPAYIVGVNHNVSPSGDDRINAQVPWEVTSGMAQVVVTVNGAASAAATVNIVPVAPGLMIFAQDSIGVLRPIAYNVSDATLPYSSGAFPGTNLAVRPASISDPQGLVLVATGLGAVNNGPPPDGSGAAQNGQSTTMSTPMVTVGGVPAQVTSSALSTYPGQYQISILMGANTPTGDAIPVVIQDPASGLQSNANLMIAVTN